MSKSGMVKPPKDYLKAVYSRIRASGGICIAEEVQMSFGRLGESFWSFQRENVTPDIITIGKPLGNGYPLAALITSAELASLVSPSTCAEALDPVGLAVGAAVLRIFMRERLQENCVAVGAHLLQKMRQLQRRFPVIGAIHGQGLALGIHIVSIKGVHQKSAKSLAQDVMYGLKQEKILVQIVGIDENVISITPPLTFSSEDADLLVDKLDQVLQRMAAASRKNDDDDDNDEKDDNHDDLNLLIDGDEWGPRSSLSPPLLDDQFNYEGMD